jgi:hypothetical protein
MLRAAGAVLTSLMLGLTAGEARAQARMFDFETTPTETDTPFTATADELVVTFSGAASVCNTYGLFGTLFGNALIQDFCGPIGQSGPLVIAFSSILSGVSFNFATTVAADLLDVEVFQGSMLLGTFTFPSVLPRVGFNFEGVATVTAAFDRLVLSSSSSGLLALDNLSATLSTVPEPLPSVLCSLGLVAVGLVARCWGGQVPMRRNRWPTDLGTNAAHHLEKESSDERT